MLKIRIQNELNNDDASRIVQANKEIIEVLWLIENTDYLINDDITIIIKAGRKYPPLGVEILTKSPKLALIFKTKLRRFMPA